MRWWKRWPNRPPARKRRWRNFPTSVRSAWRCTEQSCWICCGELRLLLEHQSDAVPEREQDLLHAGVLGDAFVELDQGFVGFGLGGQHLSAPQRVVRDQQPTLPNFGERRFEVAPVGLLVCVNEDQV